MRKLLLKKIVIIDDSEEITSSLEDLFHSVGYKPLIANNAADGINIIQKEKPSLIVLDIMMPVLDGFFVLQEIKSDTNLERIPVIMITAKTDKDTLNKSLSSGANFFLEKPFSIKKLLSLIEQIFADGKKN